MNYFILRFHLLCSEKKINISKNLIQRCNKDFNDLIYFDIKFSLSMNILGI